MPNQTKNPTTWSACKTVLKNWPAPGVLALVRELYDLSDENRRFLHARLLTDAAEKTLDDAKHQLAKIFSTTNIFKNRFRHGDAKRVVDQYAKATDDPAAVAELLLLDVALSFGVLAEVGDYVEMVDHAFSVITRMDEVFEKIPNDRLPEFITRASEIAAEYADAFGYGISDEISAFAAMWREKLARGM